MTKHNLAGSMKNAMGTVFLLAGAFFVCSTFLSMRAVFADPIAPVDGVAMPQASRAGAVRASGRTSPRNGTSRATIARTAAVPANVSGGAVVSSPAPRAAVSRGTAMRSGANGAVVSRGVTSRGVVGRTGGSSVGRAVVSRNATNATIRAGSTTNRTVRSRTNDATSARVSLQGSAIRGSKAATSNSYSYLSGKLYTGNYSNIIDSTTGLISAEAYSNCMESYYTCMDEICTARNAAQRRCACAGRVKAFAEAEAALETANEELIEVSGQLALLIATKGKDVSAAFQLTDAEKIMNCAAYVEMISSGASDSEITEWCAAHPEYVSGGTKTSSCSKTSAPSYCSAMEADYGFTMASLGGSGSDILASLKSWADAKDNTITILSDDVDAASSAIGILNSAINSTIGINGALSSVDELKDSLAETWGYELFEYAHNNVCARVLDSCFNGIYEACGAPPSGTKCGNGASQCPYNYNSVISVNNSGDYELNFVEANSGYNASNSATCFGYNTSSGDPYNSLRKPVADARRSIMQKYALDANADCDAYGEQLRATAQNIGYQKVAAQQALEQKRLEFFQEEQESIRSAAVAAGTNYNECLSEIIDCYEEMADDEDKWTTARIKTYCAQISNVPHCYEEMICNPSTSQFEAVIDVADSDTCNNTQDYTTNTCRNVVTLNEILNGTGATALPGSAEILNSKDSAAIREACMQETWVQEIRDWEKEPSNVD